MYARCVHSLPQSARCHRARLYAPGAARAGADTARVEAAAAGLADSRTHRGVTTWLQLLLSHCAGLRLQAELGQLVFPERGIPRQKKLVELRGLDSSAREHRVRLPPVVDLVDEQVREHRVNRLAMKAMLSTIEDHHLFQCLFGQAVAVADKAGICCPLRHRQIRKRREWYFALEDGKATTALFEAIKIVPVD